MGRSRRQPAGSRLATCVVLGTARSKGRAGKERRAPPTRKLASVMPFSLLWHGGLVSNGAFSILGGATYSRARAPGPSPAVCPGQNGDLGPYACCWPMLTSHGTPNLSVHMPNSSPQGCFSIAIVTFPPSDSLPQ
jgi:hypothetical protein